MHPLWVTEEASGRGWMVAEGVRGGLVQYKHISFEIYVWKVFFSQITLETVSFSSECKLLEDFSA